MSVIQDAKKQILTELKKAVGREFTPTVEDLTTPPDASLGDLAFPCFALAKGLKRSSVEIATEIAAKIAPKGVVKKILAAGPYVNFTFDDAVFGADVVAEIRDAGSSYGRSKSGAGKNVMVEYAQPNTHKEVHVGHLRNFFVGQTAIRVLEANGYDVIRACYINDLGANVARCIWGVKHIANGVVPDGEDRISFLQRMYVEATARGETDPKVKEEVSQIQRELEIGKGPMFSTWRKTWKWSVVYLKSVFKELGLPIDVWYFESSLIADTKRIVEDLIKRGIVTHSEGAWIVDLAEEKLGVNLLVKTDGTLLYNAKDIALALKKEEDHHPQRSIYVIDARQSLAMQQLFATLKRMGFTRELQHLSYEFVTLKEGAMSSRKGTFIRYEQFRDEMVKMAVAETGKRHADWSKKKVEKTARTVAFAAIRFGILKQDLDKKIVFDMEEALSFDGFTGTYLLYSYARVCGILRKAGRKSRKVEKSKSGVVSPILPVEHRLLMALAKYPETVFAAGQTMHLSSITQYLFDLCQTFSAYYDAVPVLQAEDNAVRASRLAVVRAVRQVLENGMGLMGIEPVDEM